MIDLPADLPADLVPLSWLIGVWEGTGVIDYPRTDGDGRYAGEFTHRVRFHHEGTGFLSYAAEAWLHPADDGASSTIPLLAETGFWRLGRNAAPTDPGPGLLPAPQSAPARTADDVEALRQESGGFPIEVSVAHSDGALELYLGEVNGPRIDIATDAVVRPAGARPAPASTRMYGLVEDHLLWAWDIAALGSPLASHASARLARV